MANGPGIRYNRFERVTAKELKFGDVFSLAGTICTAVEVRVAGHSVSLEFVPTKMLFGRASSMILDPEFKLVTLLPARE